MQGDKKTRIPATKAVIKDTFSIIKPFPDLVSENQTYEV